MPLTLQDFNFELPKELIAQQPVSPRDSARLLVYQRATDSIQHSQVKNLGDFLPQEALLVANNTKVRAARLHATIEEKEYEVVVLEHIDGSTYRCLVGGKGVKPGHKFHFIGAPLLATVTEYEPNNSLSTYLLRFSDEGEQLEAIFEKYGQMPLPPYITNQHTNAEQYQTVYAQHLGSAAAPTAGLHFTPELIHTLKNQGIQWAEVTLHVGVGTFLPLRHNTIQENQLHTEHTHITPKTASLLTHQHQSHKSLIAIGTTSTRTLESHSLASGIQPGWLDTNLFIYPGYAFKSVQGLLTNFHLPQSSLLLLVSAFLGNNPTGKVVLTEAEMVARLHRIYAEAIREKYRFFSFGDAMLIL